MKKRRSAHFTPNMTTVGAQADGSTDERFDESLTCVAEFEPSNVVIHKEDESTEFTTSFNAYYKLMKGSGEEFILSMRTESDIYHLIGSDIASSSEEYQSRPYEQAFLQFLVGEPKTPADSGINSTRQPRAFANLEEEIRSLFVVPEEEVFENGMLCEFSKNLLLIIDTYVNAAVEIISYLILYKKVGDEVSSEALRWLGQIDQPDSHAYRLWLLEKSLEASTMVVRDGALLGIAALDDPHAIEPLRKAIVREECEGLCEDMKVVLEQLLETAKWE